MGVHFIPGRCVAGAKVVVSAGALTVWHIGQWCDAVPPLVATAVRERRHAPAWRLRHGAFMSSFYGHTMADTRQDDRLAAPRWLGLDSVLNLRDVGGLPVAGGGSIR